MDYRVIGDLPHTDNIMNNALWIGLYPGMDQDRINYMISVIRSFCSR